ncbi:uncharacterized protein TNCV_1035961 [Trichonephila clavipes]|nr:uncharacterized protein TNCV_1035961 [Trichonephila clavipes]
MEYSSCHVASENGGHIEWGRIPRRGNRWNQEYFFTDFTFRIIISLHTKFGATFFVRPSYRKFCRYSSESSENNRIVCNIVLPRVVVRYRGKYEATTGLTTSYRVRVQQRDFYSEIVFRDVEAQTELTKLNDSEQPSITNLLILREGEDTKVYQYIDVTQNHLFNQFYVPFHKINRPYYQKCAHLFQQLFYSSYKEVLEKAFSTVEYPGYY